MPIVETMLDYLRERVARSKEKFGGSDWDAAYCLGIILADLLWQNKVNDHVKQEMPK